MIAIVVEDDISAARVRSAVVSLHCTSQRVDLARLLHSRWSPVAGIVFDAACTTAADIRPLLRRMRARYPDVPIVLYLPADGESLALAMRAAAVEGVIGTMQGGLGDAARLVDLLTPLITGQSVERILRVAMDRVGQEPHGVVRAFMRRAITSRVAGHTESVASIAAQLGMRADSLRRHWSPAPFPRPRAVLRECNVACAVTLKRDLRTGWATVARKLGADPETLRRWRQHARGGTDLPTAWGCERS